MKLMRYQSESAVDTEEVEALYMDGRSFGGRLLEGVPFKLTINADGQLEAACVYTYSHGINLDYWEKLCVEYARRCVEYALKADSLSSSIDLDDDDGFIEH